MTLVYLDNSHLVNLARKHPTPDQQIALSEKLKKSGGKLVYSNVHIIETCNHADENHIREMATFMESMPHTWIKFAEERIKDEIRSAWQIFNGKSSISHSIFAERPVDILPPNRDSLSINLVFGGKKLSDLFLVLHKNPDLKKQDENMKIRITNWFPPNKEIAQKAGWEKKVKNAFRQRLLEKIKSSIDTFIIDNNTLEKFTDYLVSTPELLKSHLLEFYTLHMLLKNQGKKFELRDLYDLEHSSAAPFVDLFTCDKRIKHFIGSAQKKFKLALGNLKILKTDAEVEDSLNT